MKKVLLLSVLVALVIALAVPMEAGAQEPPKGPANPRVKPLPIIPQEAPSYIEGEILVKFKPGVPEDIIERINAAHGVKTLRVSNLSRYRVLSVPPGRTIEEMVRIYETHRNVEAAQLNHIAYLLGSPDDPEYGYQWHYGNPPGGINIEPVWGDFLAGGSNTVSGYNGYGVVVAVIDTGLAYWGPNNSLQAPEWESQGAKVVDPYDFANDDPYAYDDHGHGTHVANTISQNTNNGLLAAGVANGASIMPIKVLDSAGSGTEYEVCQGIYWAIEHDADIINMSLAFPVSDPNELPALKEAIEAAHAAGITVVAASGNDGGPVLFPAAFDEVIAVGAVKYDGQITYYSNRGSAQELAAPGGQHCYPDDLWCQLFGGNWYDQNGDGWPDGVLQETFYYDWNTFSYQFDDVFYEGTSMASPHVAAVAALVIEKARKENIEPTPDYIRGILQSSAREAGDPGWDPLYGWGIVDAPAAIAAVVGEGAPPVAEAGGPYVGNEGSPITFDGSVSSDPDGTIVTYEWDFGDGATGSGVTASHEYADDGTYTATLTVTDNNGATGSDMATVIVSNVAPMVHAGADQTADEGETINFSGSFSDPGNGDTHTTEWDFGDEVTASGTLTPTHVYDDNGTYTVTLTVTDDDGGVGTDTATVTVNNVAPTAEAGGPYGGMVGEVITLTGSAVDPGTDDIHTYSWDFGDGTSGTGQTVSHAYTTIGTYTATLTVTDDDGGAGTDTAEVIVSQAASTAHVEITMSKRASKRWWTAQATVTIRDGDASGALIEAATVEGEWSDPYKKDTRVTDRRGRAKFSSDRISGSGTVTFTVIRVVKDGQEYIITGETSGTISN